MAIPHAGGVLGIDVGYSVKRRTTCFCLLEWTGDRASSTTALVGADPGARRTVLRTLLGDGAQLEAVAIDGPLAPGLQHVTHYRTAEALLSRGCLQKRGKPGQTSSPVGQRLHAHATELAKLSQELAVVSPATHHQAILPCRIVEAFPNIFLAALLDETNIPALRRDASDRYWELAQADGGPLPKLMASLLPGRVFTGDLAAITNHDHRAALICALTALCVLDGSHIAVGGADDGDIILPPVRHWGSGGDGVPWLQRELLAATKAFKPRTAAAVRSARVATAREPWL